MLRAFVFGIGIVVLAAVPIVVSAAPAPDAAEAERIHAAAARWQRFRLMTERGRFDVRALRFDAAGVELERSAKRPLLQVAPGETADPPRRVTWAEIHRIDGARGRSSGGIVLGAVIGAAAGGAAIAFSGGFIDGTDMRDLVGGLALGASTGMLVGGLIASSSGWHRVYPETP